MGSKCRGSKYPWGASVARANVRGASVVGATVWGAPFMDSFLCGSEEISVEHMVKKSQELVE